MEHRRPGLEPDELLLARAPASFRGAAAASARSTLAMSATRRRWGAYDAWRQYTESCGLTTAGPEMVLGLTNTRIIVWSTTFWLSRPGRIAGTLPLEKVATVATARHGMVTSLAIALTSGQIVEVEAMRGRALRRFAAAVHAQLAR